MSTIHPVQLTQSIATNHDSASSNKQTLKRVWLDRLGISASLLCVVHCLAAPFLLLLLPAAGAIWAHPSVHWVLALLVVPLALWVLFNGYRKHGNRLTLIAATLGALLILAGLISPMIYADPVIEFAVPTMSSQTEPAPPIADPAGSCTEPCCPSITHDSAAGTAMIAMPPGGLLTLIGSVLLVLAHAANLYACRCFSKRSCSDLNPQTQCGCPA